MERTEAYYKYANAIDLLVYIYSNNTSEEKVDPIDYVINLPDNEINNLIDAYNEVSENDTKKTNKSNLDDCIEFIDWISDTMSKNGRVYLETLFGLEDAGIIALYIQGTKDHKLPMPLRFFCLLDIKKQFIVVDNYIATTRK